MTETKITALVKTLESKISQLTVKQELNDEQRLQCLVLEIENYSEVNLKQVDEMHNLMHDVHIQI